MPPIKKENALAQNIKEIQPKFDHIKTPPRLNTTGVSQRIRVPDLKGKSLKKIQILQIYVA